jgi:hypothetical protein
LGRELAELENAVHLGYLAYIIEAESLLQGVVANQVHNLVIMARQYASVAARSIAKLRRQLQRLRILIVGDGPQHLEIVRAEAEEGGLGSARRKELRPEQSHRERP